MKTSRKPFVSLCFLFFFGAQAFFAPGVFGAEIQLKAGVRSMLAGGDPDIVTFENFDQHFINKGETGPSLTIDGIDSAVAGAMWTAPDIKEKWRYLRVVVDSDQDGKIQPFDAEDPIHPWNRPDNGTPQNPDDDPVSWEYIYPQSYPVSDLRGKTLIVTWDDLSEKSDFPEDFEWFWYQSRYDYSNYWWVEKGELAMIFWTGRDDEWRMLPNGPYTVDVRIDANDDGRFSDAEPSSTLIILIQTLNITGTIVDENQNPITGARVEAGSFLASAEARTGPDGRFTLTGLQPDTEYNVSIQAPGKVGIEKSGIRIDSGESIGDIGRIVMEDAVSICGVLKLDGDGNGKGGEESDGFQPLKNQWGWESEELEISITAENLDGPGWGGSMSLFQIGDAEKAFCVPVPKGGEARYELSFSAMGYSAPPVKVGVDKKTMNVGDILLTKASQLKGSVRLPVSVETWTSIEVQAVNTGNPEERYSGWGDINPNLTEGFCTDPSYTTPEDCEDADKFWTEEGWSDTPMPKDKGDFQFDGIPPGTYDVEIRVMGFMMKTITGIEILPGSDKDLGEISIESGSSITGKLIIQGDTAGMPLSAEDTGTEPVEVWINAWSPETGKWSGTSLTIPRGENQGAPYRIGGLKDGRYEIEAEIGEGFQLVDENGKSPIFTDLSGQAVVNLVFKSNEGIIGGTISGDGVTPDLSRVAVLIFRPWDWIPPGFATVANGGIDPATGRYTITGLSTDDYIVRAGMYTDLSELSGIKALISDPATAIVTERVFVENDAENPTLLDIVLHPGFSVSGTISISSTDPPWHDFGNGSGGAANGILDSTSDLYDENITISRDISGQTVTAIPLEMFLMSGSASDADPLMGVITDNGDGTASYRIDGLCPGTYIIQIPPTSQRISQILMSNFTDMDSLMAAAQVTHHWVCESRPVTVTEKSLTGRDFVLENGRKLTGKLVLPEIQQMKNETEAWDWLGVMTLMKPGQETSGHFRTLFKMNFDKTAVYEFTFDHVADGNYRLHFWTDRYVPGSVNVRIDNASAVANLSIQAGVNIVGKIIDAETGKPVTPRDGIVVSCRAAPFVEGSYRETRNDEWSECYIESDENLRKGAPDSGGGKHGEPGKFHLTAVPVGHPYIIMVSAQNGRKTGGAKNYVGRVVGGINIPDDADGEINVGEIELREGTTITGRLTDSDGKPVPGVDVSALPTDIHDGSGESSAVSNDDGYFVLYGIDPDITYYDLIAAQRPWIFDDWGREIEWGEERRFNVRPGNMDEGTGRTRDADFVMTRATASLSGTITIPESAAFSLPFETDNGYDLPSAYILLRKKGVAYRDMLEGIEGITEFRPPEVRTARYVIDNIAPGAYKIIFMNYGLPRAEIDNLVFTENEAKIVNTAWDDDFFRIHGNLALSKGGNPSSRDVNGVVCMNMKNRSVLFGRLTREADGTFSAYEVPGLAGSDTYQLIFYKDSGDDDTPFVFAVGDSFTTGKADKTYDAVIIQDPEPILILRAGQDETDPDLIRIGIFSTSFLTDNQIETGSETEPDMNTEAGTIYLKTGGGTLGEAVLMQDKRRIHTGYTKAPGDDRVEITVCVHYGRDSRTKVETLSFNPHAAMINSDRISPFVDDRVTLGHGDDTRVYIPSGALESSVNNDLKISIEKTGSYEGSLSTAAKKRSAEPSLPQGVTRVSDVYNITAVEAGTGLSAEVKEAFTIQIAYDPEKASETDSLYLYRNSGGTWTQEKSGMVVDTDNCTISAEVKSMGEYVAGMGEPPRTTTQKTSIGEGSDSECFIGASETGAGFSRFWGGCLITALFGFFIFMMNFNLQKNK